MKAMRAAQFGGPENLRLEDAPEPELRDGHVLIRVKATGINPADLVRMSGRYPQRLPLPYIPGTDVAGEVEAVAAGISHVAVGDRVFGRSINGGGYAEKACLPGPETIPLPDSLSFAEGAAIPVPFYTAYVAVHHKAQLKAGETVLISAGGGGVGVAAVQLAKVLGAQVITTVGSADKAAKIQALGADLVINYKTHDFAAEVQRLTDGKGVEVILENVATDNLAKDFSALAQNGRIVLIGTGTAKAPEAAFSGRYGPVQRCGHLWHGAGQFGDPHPGRGPDPLPAVCLRTAQSRRASDLSLSPGPARPPGPGREQGVWQAGTGPITYLPFNIRVITLNWVSLMGRL